VKPRSVLPHGQTNVPSPAPLEIIGDRWTLLILRDSFRGLRRFNEYRGSLDIASNILSDRLARLVAHDVLRHDATVERGEYRLTDKGRDVSRSSPPCAPGVTDTPKI
jgi:DNA-binding HxlR family transcriptional regulator